MKTIREWFNEVLPEPYRSWAISNTMQSYPSRIDQPFESAALALWHAFGWGVGIGKGEFWEKIYDALVYGEEIKVRPIPPTKGFGTYCRRFIEFSRK